jgi:hypothetical protein
MLHKEKPLPLPGIFSDAGRGISRWQIRSGS